MDRISNLPDDVVFHIVSFLSAKDAARTRSVSNNFKNLITIIPDLVFDGRIDKRSFKLFADPLFARHASQRIRRVSLELRPEDIFHYCNLVTEFLCSALNRGVLDFEAEITYSDEAEITYSDELEIGYSLPLEVFTCKTVVTMRLVGFVIQVLPENAALPALKNLILDSVWFDSIGACVFTRFLSACPVLVDLIIENFLFEEWKWSRVVSSLTLKRLTIRCGDFGRDDLDETISFDTPSLTYFNYSDIVASGYPVVNLNSLVEASLGLVKNGDNIDPTNLIKGLKNVQFLTLDIIDTVQVFEDFSEAVPVFENLSHLSVESERDECLDGLKVLVKNSPNLKTLTIEELHYRDENMEDVCECLLGYSILASIEVLEITNFQGDIGEMAQIKHILETLPCLELLEVHILTYMVGDERKQQIMRDLMKLPRGSSKCKVVFLDKISEK